VLFIKLNHANHNFCWDPTMPNRISCARLHWRSVTVGQVSLLPWGWEMKIRSLVLAAIAALGMSMTTAQAMPFAADRAGGTLIVPAADGCWLGWHRNPNGGCSRDRYGLFGSGIDYVPGPFYPAGPTVCGGRGVYRVCNIFGYCWLVCS